MAKSKITDVHIGNYRSKAKISQYELATKVGVVRQTIINLEKNKHNPSLLLMHAISKELGTTIEELVTFGKLEEEELKK
ncbi:helix-turn-helix transcriptional regulator [Enterococcus caccae]|uniref:HTH cro/C1-type domain-containing protein n=1 Tax=Enterococcus caccae ATCC BAA-1240 TaxID=1158612 RepID=R3TQF7_9ENTE|nr:helix-turn-helix domain-containing protein [Enterococcus caccae]EOL43779.1 hypothetical protein UC7_03109 [Enterococcus caccae ATCC BAA-1240]EOT67821.1 hypothetical protein I580_00203 [Enterococcus caccae ATCC BAA-1240]OJG28691.1 hypothetical protein RU98_GL000284 [Enterococcus caccae]